MAEREFAEIKKIVNDVQNVVEKYKHAYIVPEHLLYVLLDDKKVSKMLNSFGVDIDCIKDNLNVFFKDLETTKDISRIIPTSAYTSIMQKAVAMASLRAMEPNSFQVFLCIFNDEDSYARYFLLKNGVTENKVMEYIQNQTTIDNGFLSKYSVNLVDMAKIGKIDKIIGREKEVERMIQILHKKKSNNVIICGCAGCGKTAVVEGLAKKIADNDVPDSIKGYDIYALDMGAMIAGTKFRGEFEERLQNVIKEIVSNPKSFVFIDEMHTIMGAGTGSDGTLDAGNILKPYLSRGEIRCIGATTYEEYKNHILKDKALARRFKKIDLSEPTKEETFQILSGIKSSYEEYHKVKFTDDILKHIIDLSGRFVIDKFFPDKAIDIMDEIGSRYHCGLQNGEYVTKEDVEEIISRIANIPKVTASSTEKDKLKNLANNIKKELYGQDETVDSLVKKVKIAKAGLSNKNKPLGTFLFIGGTGNGKTELAKQLAKNLEINFIKLDMSEYSEKYSVSKLIGAAPGYVGFEQAGALTEPIIRQPNSVVLLDEIEKADKSVFDLLLQVMDEGKLTDNNGREANFRNSIIIMTSNVGVAKADNSPMSAGFIHTDESISKDRSKIIEKVMKSTFSPEFRNRIQEIILFNDLDKECMKLIVDKNIRRINNDLESKGIKITVSESVREYIADLAMKEKMGGRPVERIVDKEISEKLVDEILFGKIQGGGEVFVDYNEEFIYNF